MVTLITVVIYVVSFGITLLCLRQFAVWLGAGQTSYASCFIALLLAYGVSLGVMKGVEVTQAPPGLVLISLPIGVLIYAMILQAGFFKALAIAILSGIVSAVLLLMLMMLVGFMGLGVAGAMLGTGMVTMDSGWYGDMPMPEEGDRDDMVVTSRTTTRSDGTTTVTITTRNSLVTPSITITSPESAPRSTPPQQPKATFAFQIIDLDSLPIHQNARVKVRTRDGREHTGTLLKVENGIVTLRQRVSGGTFDFQVRANGILEVKVWAKVSA